MQTPLHDRGHVLLRLNLSGNASIRAYTRIHAYAHIRYWLSQAYKHMHTFVHMHTQAYTHMHTFVTGFRNGGFPYSCRYLACSYTIFHVYILQERVDADSAAEMQMCEHAYVHENVDWVEG